MNFAKALRASTRISHWRALSQGVVPTIEHGAALAGINPTMIIDVGANKGQFASFAAAQWPAAKIVSFEPLSNPAKRFRRVLGDRAELIACAIGEVNEIVEINVASREDSSSILHLGAAQMSLFKMGEVRTEKVESRRLDKLFNERSITPLPLLKIDVQGFEYQVLRGLGLLARFIRWIYVEVSFIELYEDQHLFADIDNLLQGLGFHFCGLSNELFKNGQLVQADALFSKAKLN